MPIRKFPNNIVSSLRYEPVPITAPFSNLRRSFTARTWELITNRVRDSTDPICHDCGALSKLEIHEDWRYDDTTLVQQLDALVLLCLDCHEVRHLACAVRAGRGRIAISHLQRTLDLTSSQAYAYVTTALDTWKERNKLIWSADLHGLSLCGPHPKGGAIPPLGDLGVEFEHSATCAMAASSRLPLLFVSAHATHHRHAHIEMH